MHIKKKTLLRQLLFILLLFIYLSQIGLAGEQIVLSPQEGHSNQNQINEAISQAASSAKGASVFLTEGLYLVDNTIIMKSNVRLLGDSNAIVKVWGGSSQWFKGKVGVISCKEAIQNVEIAGFQIDGNIKELPKSYADSRPGTDHDCEKLIILWGNSNNFAKNIRIHDMKLYNSYSDGFYVIYAEDVEVYNNVISNCQHEGIYLSVVKNGHIHDNKIAGITSDCARLDNCQKCLIEYNIFFSYGGESYGAYKHGENGLQIGNAGSSHGYNAVKKEYPTRNIEVRYNTFSDPGLKAIWYHGGENVYIHDNEFVDASELETMGIPIGDISMDNQPTVEMSEKVFDSIFDILDIEFVDNATTEQTPEDFNYEIVETEKGKVAGGIKIIGFNNMIKIENKTYVSSLDDAIIKTSVIRNPSLDGWAGGIADIDENVNLTVENGTLKATLTAKATWYNMKTNSKGQKVKGNLKTSEYIFTDTYSPAPNVLQQPEKVQGIIYQYPTYFTLKVPSDGLTKVLYEYDGNHSEHIFLVGARNTTESGVKFTEYSELEHWDGDVTNQADWVQIPGRLNPDKLKVTAYTPYKEIEVKKYKAYNKEAPDEPIAWWFKPSLGLLGVIVFYLRRKWDLFRRT